MHINFSNQPLPFIIYTNQLDLYSLLQRKNGGSTSKPHDVLVKTLLRQKGHPPP